MPRPHCLVPNKLSPKSQLLRVDLILNSEVTLLWFQAKPMTVYMDLQVPLAFSIHIRKTAKIFLGRKW